MTRSASAMEDELKCREWAAYSNTGKLVATDGSGDTLSGADAAAEHNALVRHSRAMPAAPAGEALRDAQDIIERTAELMQRHGETLEQFYERAAIATRTWAYQWQHKHLNEDNGYQPYAALHPAAAQEEGETAAIGSTTAWLETRYMTAAEVNDLETLYNLRRPSPRGGKGVRRW